MMFKGSLNDTHHSGFFDEFGDVFKGFVPVAERGENHGKVDARDDRHFVVFQHAVRDIGRRGAHHIGEDEGAVRIFSVPSADVTRPATASVSESGSTSNARTRSAVRLSQLYTCTAQSLSACASGECAMRKMETDTVLF